MTATAWPEAWEPLQEGEEGASGPKHSPGAATKREPGQAGVCEQGHWVAALQALGSCCGGSAPVGPLGTSSPGIKIVPGPGETAGVVWPGLHRDALAGDPMLHLLPSGAGVGCEQARGARNDHRQS